MSEKVIVRHLRAVKVIETVDKLSKRISARFPSSGLSGVAAEVLVVAKEAQVRAQRIRRPNITLRVVSALLALCILALLGGMAFNLRRIVPEFEGPANFVAFMDSGLASVVFIGATILFLLTIESRLKRQRALDAIHELRSIAHIIDMHQLTKDPEALRHRARATSESSDRFMNAGEMGRYLDYCSELLSLTSKIAALYVQEFSDPVALDAVDQVETLCTGLSRKIWQKIMLLKDE